jgi:hypothetical protein
MEFSPARVEGVGPLIPARSRGLPGPGPCIPLPCPGIPGTGRSCVLALSRLLAVPVPVRVFWMP